MAKKVYIGAENFPKIALPAGYTQLEYIESSGTQYIDTGLLAESGLLIDFTFSPLEVGAALGFMGAKGSGDTRIFPLHYSTTYNSYGVGYGTYNNIAGHPININGKIHCESDLSIGSQSVKFDGETIYTGANTATITTNLNLFLFAANNAGTASWHVKMKLYHCVIYKNSVMVRNLVPCINAGGTIGLFDLVNSQFYANNGSGTFIAGPEYAESVAMNIDEIYMGIDAVARSAQSGYIGREGVARQFWGKGGVRLRELNIGESVYIDINGAPIEFIVVHQGSPSAEYDDSCNGTWLLMKECYTERAYTEGSTVHYDYGTSDINTYLNNTLLNMFNSDIQGAIKKAKIPYCKFTTENYDGASTITIKSGADGLSTKLFLLSTNEVGFNYTESQYSSEGDILDYFNGTENAGRKAYYNGVAKYWWLRSCKYSPLTYSAYVTNEGSLTTGLPTTTYFGVRPCLIMPFNATVDKDYNVVPPAKFLGDLNAGDSVFMNVDGVSKEFIVVNQGLPSSAYDSSCDGTWLLMKDSYEMRTWDTTNNDYANSDIHAYLNGDFLKLFEADVLASIKQVKIPYTKGTGASGTVASGASGLSAKAFVLSVKEVNASDTHARVEGAAIEYFSSAADGDRIAYYNDTAASWHLRTPSKDTSINSGLKNYFIINNAGVVRSVNITTATRGVRPCVILPSDTGIDSDYNVTPPPLPTTLGELNVGDTVYMNVNGISTEFIAVNQGLPSSDYDSSCDGTWLLMKDAYVNKVWRNSSYSIAYGSSDVSSYLKNTFIGLFDFDIQASIKTVTIPTISGNVSAKAFLLSYAEAGYGSKEGAVLEYFKGLSNSEKIALLNGSATNWWLRTKTGKSDVYVYMVNFSSGNVSNMVQTNSYGVRPCIILPSTTGINESFTVTPPPVTVNTLSVGDTVKIKVNGVATEFIIVHKGRPSTAYNSSCDGVWVLMKDIYELREWHSSALNYYYGSTIHSYLNNTFLNLIESNVRSVIKQVRIPHTNGYGNSGSVSSGSSGLSTKIFLPSAAEVGFDSNHIDAGRKFNIEGATLSYFSGLGTNNTKRNAFYNGSGKRWWTRSPGASTSYDVIAVEYTTYSGYIYGIVDVQATYPWGVRPAFVLPYTAVIDENNNIIG